MDTTAPVMGTDPLPEPPAGDSMVARYLVVIDRYGEEDYGDPAVESGVNGAGDQAVVQLAKELQRACDGGALDGHFQIIRREVVAGRFLEDLGGISWSFAGNDVWDLFKELGPGDPDAGWLREKLAGMADEDRVALETLIGWCNDYQTDAIGYAIEEQARVDEVTRLRAEIESIAGRAALGEPCTQDESATIMRFFDLTVLWTGDEPIQPPPTARLAAMFPAEWNDWTEAVAKGDRPRRLQRGQA